MPLFFLISGYCYNDAKYTTVTDFLKSKYKTLFLPYLVLSFYCLVIDVFKNVFYCLRGNLSGAECMSSAIKRLIGIIVSLRGTEYNIGIWYIPLIMVTMLLFFTIVKISKKNDIFLIAFSSILFFIGIILAVLTIKLPWGVDVACIAIVFVLVGYLLKKHSLIDVINKQKFSIWIVMLLSTFAIHTAFTYMNYRFIKTNVDMYTSTYGHFLYYLLASTGGAILVILLCIKLHVKIIAQIGKNSLYFYGVHGIFIEVIGIIAYHIIPDVYENVWYGAIFAGIVVVLSTLIIYAFLPLYNKVLKKMQQLLSLERFIR